MSAPTSRPSAWQSLYNHNPFYAISAVLMLYAVRSGYGQLKIGDIDCWIMMGVLATYTLVLAGIGVFIVRWGKVWEDARSIFVVLLLLLLAVSISADDLFARMESFQVWRAAALLVCGFLFSAIVSELVLFGAGIRVGLLYRIPYHLLLALFYVVPWLCAPQLHPPESLQSLEWTVFGFSVAAAVLFLTLLPAVRRGPAFVADNGSPWRWPAFPWTAFWVIAIAVCIRSYTLCMVFGFHGPIWKYVSGGRVIVFNTIWGTYFLVPLGLAILVLLLEMGLVTKSNRLLAVMKAAPVLLILSLPLGGGKAFDGFLQTVTVTIGSPIWLTTWLVIAFYAWAWIRRVQWAGTGILATLALVSVVGPATISAKTLITPLPWPFFVIGAVLAVRGIWHRSSGTCAAAAVVATLGLWFLLSQTESRLADFRFTICYHLLWLVIVVLGLTFRDRFAGVLCAVGAVQMPLAAMVVTLGGPGQEVPSVWRLSYAILLTLSCLAIARLWRSPWYLYASAATATVATYASTVLGFRNAVSVLGRPAMTAFGWSMGMLLLALLISAHKASWLPHFPPLRWRNGSASEKPPGPAGPVE